MIFQDRKTLIFRIFRLGKHLSNYRPEESPGTAFRLKINVYDFHFSKLKNPYFQIFLVRKAFFDFLIQHFNSAPKQTPKY